MSETPGLREWRNGNLCVTLEPSQDGSRLHLRTQRDERVGAIGILTALALFPLLMLILGALTGNLGPDQIQALVAVGLSSTFGAAGVWATQRSWAATRERQMQAIAQRASALSPTALSAPDTLPTSSPRIDSGLLDLDTPNTEARPSSSRTRA